MLHEQLSNHLPMLGVSQILDQMHTRATYGREPIVLTYVMADRALQIGLKFGTHPPMLGDSSIWSKDGVELTPVTGMNVGNWWKAQA
jgi:hypothetical protein